MEKITWLLELMLSTICRIFVATITALNYIVVKIAYLFQIILVVLGFTGVIFWIESLTPAWQSVAISVIVYWLALTFVSIFTLCIWKPKKFHKIFDKALK